MIALWLCSFWMWPYRSHESKEPVSASQTSKPNKQAKPIQPDKMKWDKDWGTAHKVMWLFLIPQRHTHKCMFNKTKINCPMSAIVHSAIASNIRSSDSVYIIFFFPQSSSFTPSLYFFRLFLICAVFPKHFFIHSPDFMHSEATTPMNKKNYLQVQTVNPLIAISSSNRAISYVDFVTLLSMLSHLKYFFFSRLVHHLHSIWFSLFCVCTRRRPRASSSTTTEQQKNIPNLGKNVCACAMMLTRFYQPGVVTFNQFNRCVSYYKEFYN